MFCSGFGCSGGILRGAKEMIVEVDISEDLAEVGYSPEIDSGVSLGNCG